MKTVMKKQSGFTLIELIMVIVILGILAAVALPKFVNLGVDARAAAVKALEGSMRATNAIIYAKANVNNSTGATGTVSINGTTVNTKYGYAATVAPDMVSIMDLSPDFASAATTVRHLGAAVSANCGVTYTVPGAAASAPAYALDISAC